MASPDDIEEQKLVNEEYKVWRKNAAHLYDYLLAQGLEWPSLTTQWFPDDKAISSKDYGYPFVEQRVLFGTNTSGKGRDELIIARIVSPSLLTPELKDGGKTSEMFREAWDKFYDESGEIGGYTTGVKPKGFEITQRIVHDGEVNKARYMPQNIEIIATTGVGGQVAIFDRTKHPNMPANEEFRPEMRLVGHTSEGFGLNWDPHQEARLVTASTDETVRIWDIEKGYSKANASAIEAVRVLNHHNASANDAEFNPLSKNILATVGDDKRLCIIDLRDSSPAPSINIIASKDAINALAWHPDILDGDLILTGDAEGVVATWDIRMASQEPLQTVKTHTGPINKVQWHPEEPSVCASCSGDRQVHFYDLNRKGDELTQEDLDDGPPELIFIHGGFTNAVSDFDFSKIGDSWRVIAASEDNQIQAFTPARRLVMPEDMADMSVDLSDISSDEETGEEIGASPPKASRKINLDPITKAASEPVIPTKISSPIKSSLKDEDAASTVSADASTTSTPSRRTKRTGRLSLSQLWKDVQSVDNAINFKDRNDLDKITDDQLRMVTLDAVKGKKKE